MAKPVATLPRWTSSAIVAWIRGALCLLVLCAAPPAAAALSELESSALLMEGNSLFQQGNELATSKPDEAKELYLKSAMRFERIVRDGGVENGKLYYNIGNAYFRAGDLGRGILNYRRAGQFIPNDRNVQQNLAFARSRRKDAMEEQEDARVFRTLMFWHYDFSFGQRFALFTAAFLTLWTAAAARVFFSRPFLKWIIGIAAALAAALGISLLTESLALQRDRPGVILAEEVTARKGDSDTYEASFQEPLHAGTEFLLVENRDKWIHVELPDGRRCWLPAQAAEMLR
jgi:tetratricopeptide (TPR) repeat protein